MNAAKHTPGPWEWERIEEDGYVPVSTLKGPDVLCRFWDSGCTGERDARLIAAAPDLLAAVQELTENRWDHYNDKLWANALAAIAKATGTDIA